MIKFLPLLISTLYRLVYNMSFFLWSLFLLERGFTVTQVGLILGVNSLASLLTSLPSGFANDRFSSKNLIVLGAGLFVVMLVLFLMTSSFWLIVLAFVLGGVGHRLLDIGIDSFVIRSSAEVAGESVIPWFLALRFMGIALGMILGTQLWDNFGVSLVVYVSLIGLVLVGLISLFLKDEAKVELVFTEIWSELKNVKQAFFLIGLAIFALHFGAEAVSYAPFLKENLGLEGGQIGFYMAGAISVMGVASFFFSRAIEKGKSGEYFLLGGLFVSGLFHMLMTIEILPISFLARVVHEVGDAAVFAFMYNGLAILFPRKHLASNFGVLTFLTVIAASLSAAVYGYIVDFTGLTFLPLFISGLVSVVLAFIMWVALRMFPALRAHIFVN